LSHAISICGFLVLMLAPAFATTITFGSGGTPGFNSVGNLGASFTASNLTVSAFACGATGSQTCFITSSNLGGEGNGFGYGVNRSDSTAIHGSGLPQEISGVDILRLIFAGPVTLKSFTLEDADPANGVEVVGEAGQVFLRIAFNAVGPGTYTDVGDRFDSSPAVLSNATGRTFDFKATAGGIRLRSVTFVEIPEPGTYVLIGSGLVAMLLFGKRWARFWAHGKSPQ